jgi:hypothetical protein
VKESILMAILSLAAMAIVADVVRVPQWATQLVYIAVIIAASLAILFSMLAMGGRVARIDAVQARLRAGLITGFVVIVLAALDIYLALTGL